MARDKSTLGNQIDNSTPALYPNGRIKDNPGDGSGTPVDERVYGDIHENNAFLLRRYDIIYNNLPDNTTNGYQFVEGMRALPSKNDMLLTIGQFNATTFSAAVKIGLLEENEVILCRAGLNSAAGFTSIRGNDNATVAVSFPESFLSGEYLYLIRTSTNVLLIRLITAANLNTATANLNFLKAATQAQETGGTITTAATTPGRNRVTFERRVNGDDSDTFLATDSQNGIYPSEHFTIVENLGASPIRNTGFISGLDVNGSTSVSFGGDITAASVVISGGSRITCTMNNAMADTNYVVDTSIQSLSANPVDDVQIASPVFRPISTTQFLWVIQETGSVVQNLRIHFQVRQL